MANEIKTTGGLRRGKKLSFVGSPRRGYREKGAASAQGNVPGGADFASGQREKNPLSDAISAIHNQGARTAAEGFGPGREHPYEPQHVAEKKTMYRQTSKIGQPKPTGWKRRRP